MVLKVAETIDEYKFYAIAIYIYENNGDVVRDIKKLRKLKKKYKKVKFRIIYSDDYIRKNKKDKFLTMNSVVGFLSLRIKKGNTITLLCDLDGRAGENILNEVKTNFETLT